MNKYIESNLVDLMETIDHLNEILETVQDDFGHNVKAMYVEHRELKHLKFDLDRVENELGNLKEYIEQYLKEEKEDRD